jgi:hypothetical protein
MSVATNGNPVFVPPELAAGLDQLGVDPEMFTLQLDRLGRQLRHARVAHTPGATLALGIACMVFGAVLMADESVKDAHSRMSRDDVAEMVCGWAAFLKSMQ